MATKIQTSAPVETVQIGKKSASLGQRIHVRDADPALAVYRIAPRSWHGIRDFAVFHNGELVGFLVKRGTAKYADHYRMFCPAVGRACLGTEATMRDAVAAVRDAALAAA